MFHDKQITKKTNKLLQIEKKYRFQILIKTFEWLISIRKTAKRKLDRNQQGYNTLLKQNYTDFYTKMGQEKRIPMDTIHISRPEWTTSEASYTFFLQQ